MNEQKKSGKTLEEAEKEQKAKEEAEAKRIAEAEAKNKAKKELDETKAKIVEFFVENKTNVDLIKPVLALLKENGCSNPNEITDLEVAKKIFKACK